MGSFIEVNDTLLITTEQGFPSAILNLERHLLKPIGFDEVEGRVFQFVHKGGARLFHLEPVRVFLVHKVGGKWLHWGKAVIISQTISQVNDADGYWIVGEWETSGQYKIIEIYEPEYQKLVTKRESPKGCSFWD